MVPGRAAEAAFVLEIAKMLAPAALAHSLLSSAYATCWQSGTGTRKGSGVVHTTLKFLSYCSVLTVLSMGCGGDSGGAKSASDMSKPGNSTSDSTNSDENPVNGTPSASSFRDACVAACHAQGQCLQFSDSDCMDACEAQSKELATSCLDEATAEQNCLAGLTCDQAKAYGTQGRRTHSVCGAQATAYFAACTLDAGATPPACSALCARYEACDASDVSVAACEEKCILQVTSFHGTAAGCGDAFLAFIGCAAQSECAEVQELASSSVSPAACNDALEAMNQACN